jgi:signal transduction histidine kinase
MAISPLTTIAIVSATACFVISLMHGILYFRSGRNRTYLLAVIASVAAAYVAIIDLLQITSADIETHVAMSRYMHVGLLVVLVSLVMLVRSYLDAGPRWLIILIAALFTIATIQSMVLPYGVVHSEITELMRVEAPWGEPFYVARGPVNPGKHIGDSVAFLIPLFIAIASVEAARRGLRRRALLIGGSAAVFVLSAGTLAILQDAGVVAVPLAIPTLFLIVIAALTVSVINDAIDAADAAREVAQLRRIMILGEMVGGLTHEINQPLSAILSNAQAARRFLEKDDVDLDEIREIIDDVIADDKRASGIVDGFRNMLQRDTGRGVEADVNEAVADAARLVKGDFHAHDIPLRLELQPDHKPVRADAVELEQVLVNLLMNAARATAANDGPNGHVTVSCEELDGVTRFSVRDRGHGIDDDMMEKLFEPFVSGNEGGLGLGLSVCKRIVERSGGKIWAMQREGGGAVFSFTLPLADTKVES